MSSEAGALGPPLAPLAPPTLVVNPESGGTQHLRLAEQVRLVASSLPDPESIGKGAWIAVSSGKLGKSGFVSRLFAAKPRPIPLAVRCTALLLRGYRDVCANEAGTAFGRR